MAYYHVLIETIEKIKRGKNEEPTMGYEIDIEEAKRNTNVIKNVALPYVTGQEFFISGRPVTKSRISRFMVTKTEDKSDVLVKKAYSRLAPGILMIFSPYDVVFSSDAQDITNEVIAEARALANETGLEITSKQVFEPKPTSQNIFNTTVNTANAMVQAGAMESQQTMNVNDKTDQEYFAKLLETVKGIRNNEQILLITQEMERAVVQKDSKTFGEKYTKFMASVADHMTIILPFVPWLTKLLKQL